MRNTSLKRYVLRFAAVLASVIGLPLALSAAGVPEAITLNHPKVREVIPIQEEYTPQLMQQPEILGTALGQDTDGEIALIIYVNSESKNLGEVMRAIPPTLKGKRVRAELTEPFVALGKPGTSTRISHTAKQTPPIKLGTSGGWGLDLANGYCCGGTLGSLVQIGSDKYILSNYHVFESDIVEGGNGIAAVTGQPIIQPGLIDVGCDRNSAQVVATLVVKTALPGNNVDCSVALVDETKNMVDSTGAILGIGTISSSTTAAYISQPVKKSGRTTGLTKSKVSALNAVINVTYANECAGGTAFTETFTGQIMIANRGSKFLAGGDSGSLMVEDVAKTPRAVGLLYAGSSLYAIANPIDDVLGFLNATMVGN